MGIYRIINCGGFEEYIGLSAMQLKKSAVEATGGEGERKAETEATIDTIVADNALPTIPSQSRVMVTLRGGEVVGSHLGGPAPREENPRAHYSRPFD